jgi:hypothetical protein
VSNADSESIFIHSFLQSINQNVSRNHFILDKLNLVSTCFFSSEILIQLVVAVGLFFFFFFFPKLNPTRRTPSPRAQDTHARASSGLRAQGSGLGTWTLTPAKSQQPSTPACSWPQPFKKKKKKKKKKPRSKKRSNTRKKLSTRLWNFEQRDFFVS